VDDAAIAETVFRQLDGVAGRRGGGFLIGLSGGSDSLALTVLANRWAQARGATVRAAVVDHGLRPGSPDEANAAADLARSLGVEADVVRRDGPALTSRVQERARTARHQLLASQATQVGARTILLGHTSDDQAETVALRLARGTGPEGLVGMAPLSPSPAWRDYPDMAVARPMLDCSRKSLQALLTRQGLGWIDDPSNADCRHSRVAVRQRLAALAAAGAGTEGLLRVADLAGALRTAVDRDAIALLAACNLATGMARIPATVLSTHPVAGARLLGWLSAAVGEAARAPDLQRASGLLRRVVAPGFRGQTFAGAMLRLETRRTGQTELVVSRAPRRRDCAPCARSGLPLEVRVRRLAGRID
jgi:tRNA(Ile)-lysidine synthase